MGFFSGIRRRIKKIIPKEVRPAIPFIAAALPFTAPAGLGALGAKSATGSFLRASLAKGISESLESNYKRDEDNLLKVDREIKQLINEMELLETKKNEV